MAKSPLWYRWAVNYRDRRGKIHQTIVESTSHRDAIVAASAAHPAGRDFTAIKLSTRPL
jgi:hypothetical protein